jgi:hypothetical protein
MKSEYRKDQEEIGRAVAVLKRAADEHKIPLGDAMFAGIWLAVSILELHSDTAAEFNGGMQILKQELQMYSEAVLSTMQRSRAN